MHEYVLVPSLLLLHCAVQHALPRELPPIAKVGLQGGQDAKVLTAQTS